MPGEITLVEVFMVEYKAGDKEWSNYLNKEIEFSTPNWESVTEQIPEVIEAREKQNRLFSEAEKNRKNKLFLAVDHVPFSEDRDLLFTGDCTCFSFRFIGQSFDHEYSGGMESEYLEGGADCLFEGWTDELIKLGRSTRDDKARQGLNAAIKGNCVRFVTAWEWRCWEDSYNHEWDSEWELLGLVDLNDIKRVLTKEYF